MVPNDLRGGKSHTNNMELYSLNQLKKDFDMCHPPASFSRVPLLWTIGTYSISVLKVPIWKDSTNSVQWNIDVEVFEIDFF